MRLKILGLAVGVGLAFAAGSANAAGFCGPWRHPVPAHWTWRGFWVPPHCAPNRVAYVPPPVVVAPPVVAPVVVWHPHHWWHRHRWWW